MLMSIQSQIRAPAQWTILYCARRTVVHPCKFLHLGPHEIKEGLAFLDGLVYATARV